ncbi:MAG: SigB/SigF/SigG family RNA polymerase sigma factor [Clostridia bacterium]|nr:SigB/SigF/SigG family RNA polymerase sigma factor [Clostridia bacterium]
MPKNDNANLIKLAQSGERDALDDIIQQNMGLVKKIVTRFKDRGCEYDDLVQIGTIGMIKAVKSFDFSFNTVFSTYAVPLIIGEIRRYLRDDGLIKVSRSIKKNGIDIMRKKEEFEKSYSREPSVSELAALCELSVDDVICALEAISPVRSLQEPLNDDESSTLGSVLSDNENEIDKLTERLALKEALKSLPEQQRQIIVLRYFKDMSQQQTGDILGLTQVKVSREEKRIINYLRQAL